MNNPHEMNPDMREKIIIILQETFRGMAFAGTAEEAFRLGVEMAIKARIRIDGADYEEGLSDAGH